MKIDNEHQVAGTPLGAGSRPQPSGASANVLRGRMHKVSAIYPNPEEAMAVGEQLKTHGFLTSAISILHAVPDADEGLGDENDGSDEVLKDMLVDGAIGTGVDTGVGVLGTVVLLAADVTLFVASPVVAALAMVGWFAGLGGVLGAMVGSDDQAHKDGKFAALVRAAIGAGNTVLLVRTYDPAETQRAKEIIRVSLQGRDQGAMGMQ